MNRAILGGDVAVDLLISDVKWMAAELEQQDVRNDIQGSYRRSRYEPSAALSRKEGLKSNR